MDFRTFVRSVIASAAVTVTACGSNGELENIPSTPAPPGGSVVGDPAPPSPEKPPAPGAGLRSLTVSSAALTPAFSTNVLRYQAAVEVMAKQPFTVTATPEDPNATVLLNGVALKPGVPSKPLSIAEAFNPIDIKVILPKGPPTSYRILAAAAQDAYIKASNTRPNQTFSNDIAISGNLLVVGAWGDSSASSVINQGEWDQSAPNAGAAYVYSLVNGTWEFEAYLKASNNRAQAYFGITVAIDGDTIAVGAQDESSAATGINGDGTDTSAPNAGAAYVFRRVPCPGWGSGSSGSSGSGSTCNGPFTWIEEAYVKASNTHANAGFGTAVSIKNNTLAVGAWRENGASTGVNGNQNDLTAFEAGAAYVYTRTGTTWTQQAYLKASNARANARFGNSVAVDGDSIAVGSLWEASIAKGVNGDQTDTSAQGAGAAYVFTRVGETWTQQAYFKPTNTTTEWRLTGDFSINIALSGDTLAVGALLEPSAATGTNGNANDQNALIAGAVFIYRRTGVSWAVEAYLKAPNTRPLALFGYSVDLDGDTLVVGSPQESSNATGIDGNLGDTSMPYAGAAYVFKRDGGAWTRTAYLKASNTRPDALFGYAIAVSGDHVAVGARFETSGTTNVNGNQADTSAPYAGAAYVFR